MIAIKTTQHTPHTLTIPNLFCHISKQQTHTITSLKTTLPCSSQDNTQIGLIKLQYLHHPTPKTKTTVLLNPLEEA
jgi:hypothetical protein